MVIKKICSAIAKPVSSPIDGVIAAAGGGGMHGYVGKRADKKRRKSIIREKDAIVQEILDYLLQNSA